ncbi:heme-binding protein [Amycolatopsis bartoniae]|nr:heme-binding protein [Amycolatopsis bartoniae]
MSSQAALEVVAAAQRAAETAGQKSAIAVVDAAGHLCAFVRLDGAPAQASQLSQDKAYTAAGCRSNQRSRHERFLTGRFRRRGGRPRAARPPTFVSRGAGDAGDGNGAGRHLRRTDAGHRLEVRPSACRGADPVVDIAVVADRDQLRGPVGSTRDGHRARGHLRRTHTGHRLEARPGAGLGADLVVDVAVVANRDHLCRAVRVGRYRHGTGRHPRRAHAGHGLEAGPVSARLPDFVVHVTVTADSEHLRRAVRVSGDGDGGRLHHAAGRIGQRLEPAPVPVQGTDLVVDAAVVADREDLCGAVRVGRNRHGTGCHFRRAHARYGLEAGPVSARLPGFVVHVTVTADGEHLRRAVRIAGDGDSGSLHHTAGRIGQRLEPGPPPVGVADFVVDAAVVADRHQLAGNGRGQPDGSDVAADRHAHD